MGKYIIQKAIDRKDMSAKALAAMAGKQYVLQPKWDGCHLVIKFREKDWSCESATGEPVRSCDHIASAVFDLLDGTVNLTGKAVVGEVWMENTPFAEISGAFRRHAPQPQLRFVILDVVKVNDDDELYEERGWYDRFREYSPAAQAYHPVLIVAGFTAGDPDKYARELKAQGGYDGAIMRDLSAPYKVGRCRAGEVVKVKPLVEFDLEVVGAATDFGEKTGKPTAALICRFRNGALVRVATGLTDAQIAEIHCAFDDRWRGKIIAVEAMDETADGSLREPRFKGLRFDKAEADF